MESCSFPSSSSNLPEIGLPSRSLAFRPASRDTFACFTASASLASTCARTDGINDTNAKSERAAMRIFFTHLQNFSQQSRCDSELVELDHRVGFRPERDSPSPT